MNKIMIVEDDNALRTNIVELLEAEGYSVISAGNGLEALNYMKKEIPDLIISDIMMPYIDGIELLRRIQSDPVTNSVPFIFLTARIDSNDVRKGMNEGANDYLIKPFKTGELLAAVTTQLKKKEHVMNRFEEMKKFIAQKVPHELRTPLIPIFGYTDIIIDEIDSLDKKDILKMAKTIKKAGERIHDRIEKFLSYTEIELLYKEVSLGKKVDNRIYQINQEKVEKNLITTFNNKERADDLAISIEPASLKIGEEHLMMLMNELSDNALKFSEKNTQVKIMGICAGDNYKIIFDDNGSGMFENEVVQIEAFKQFRREIYQQTGIGLGLTIVKRILDIWKGRLEIKSKTSGGTIITVFIPVKN